MSFISVLKSVPGAVAAKAAPLTAKASAHAPELLLGGGMACIGGGTVYACKKTLDLATQLEESRTALNEANDLMKEQQENAGVYDDTIRVSVGIEDINDLISDFDNAINA